MDDAIQKLVDSGVLEGKRIFTTNREYSRFRRPFKKPYEFKPVGLWYAMGSSWIEWCLGENFNGIGKYVYEIQLDDRSNILFLDTKDKVLDFSKKYKKTEYPYNQFGSVMIDWNRVKNEYDGIEINPYFYSLRLSFNLIWYYGWDIPSGCIWKARAKRKINFLAEYNKKEFVLL